MYYVIFTGAGKEKTAEEWIKQTIPEELYNRCFHPEKHLKKKIRGKWMNLYQRLLPGYIFLKTDQMDVLYEELRKLPVLLNLLGKNEEGEILPLNRADEVWLKKVSGIRPEEPFRERPMIELSQVGFNENDEVVILSGPLKELTGQVKKLHLHKRIAEVEVEFMGRKSVIHLGIELVEKAKPKESAGDE